MDVRQLGGSSLATPRLVLGGNVFGWTATGAEGFAILDRFVEAGGAMIDTADVYSAWVPGHKGGESETYIGEWLKRRGRRDDVLIATKVGMLPGEGGAKLEPARIAAAAEASIQRLGTHIDLYYAHQDDEGTPLSDTLGAFDSLVKAGKVRALGASNYSAERLARALAISEREGLARYEVLQPEYNLMARDTYEGPLQQLCIDEGVGVLPYFGLASGFLTGKYRSEADFAKSVRGGRMPNYLNDKGRRAWPRSTRSPAAGATPAQVALAWLDAQPGVTPPSPAPPAAPSWTTLLGVLTLELSGEQIERLTAAAA